jgi:hypothetical protein
MISLKNSDMVNANFSRGRSVFDEFGALILGLNYDFHNWQDLFVGVGSLP